MVSTYASNELYIDAIKRAEDEMDRKLGRTFYQPKQVTEFIDSYDPIDTTVFVYERATYGGNANNYRPNTFSSLTNRLIKLDDYPVITLHQLIINAQPTDITTEAVGTGDAVETAFTLDKNPVVYSSVRMYVNAVETVAFSIDYDTGIVTFDSAPGDGLAVTADYTHCSGGVIVSSANYLLRAQEGVIILKSASVPYTQDPLIMAATYTHCYYDRPPLVDRIAVKTAAIDLIQTTQMSTDSPLSIQSSNIGVILGEIASHYKSLGRKMTLTRI